MTIRPENYGPKELHKLIIGCVVPRPIAWISTVDPQGATNLAPFSFFNGVASNPPTVSVSFSFNPHREDNRKDTLRNILATGEFVINSVGEPFETQMHASSGDYPLGASEIEALTLTTVPSRTVAPGRLGESGVAFECRLDRTIPIGSGPGSATLVLGRVLCIEVVDGLVNEQLHMDLGALKPIGRLAGNGYCYVRELFDLGPRPDPVFPDR